MERQSDRCGAGHRPRDCRASSSATGRRRVRGGADPEALARLGQASHLRWCRRGQTNRAGLFRAAQGARTMDVASAGRQSRGTEHRCPGQRQHDRPYAKKNILKPHLKEQWVIPPDANAAFVAAMEDILEVYQRPRDPEFPMVCVDETSKQLIAETRVRIPAKWDSQSVHDVRGAGRLAACQGHRPSYRVGLCPGPQGIIRYAVSQRKENRARPGQSQYAQTGVTLRSVSSSRGAAARRTVRMALHAKAWKLAGF